MGRANNITLIGKLNRAEVYEFLFRNGDSSIQQISDALGLSLPAVTRAIEIGLNQNLFVAKGLVGGDRGRKAMYYGLNPDKGHSISFYIRKNVLHVIIKDFVAKTLSTEDIKIETENVVDLIDSTVERYSVLDGNIKFIFVVVCGDVHEGLIVSCRAREELTGFDMKLHLQEKFGKITVVENDLSAAVTAGFKYADNPKNEIIITFLYGKNLLGAGVMINNHTYKGANGRQMCFDAMPPSRVNRSYLSYVGGRLQSMIALYNPHTVILYPMDDKLSFDELTQYIEKNMPEDIVPTFYERHNLLETCITGMVRLCIEEVKKMIMDHEPDGEQYRVLG
ncbi:MAG: ROK family protein [Faecalibacterium sp.]|nr:ROK family protein [Ruminococcus sp.]MCM1392444.1 ROK family protein [Ruminococcus sp.]MCM1486183.1 ROK family protein [Faecalibacterium sp.]